MCVQQWSSHTWAATNCAGINTDYTKRCVSTSIGNCRELTHSSLSPPHVGHFVCHSNLTPGAKPPVQIQMFRLSSLSQPIWTRECWLGCFPPVSALVFQQNFPFHLQPLSHNIYTFISGIKYVCTMHSYLIVLKDASYVRKLWITAKNRLPKTFS